MAFKTLFFGNGLGRAIDNNYFQLHEAIAKIWNDHSHSTALPDIAKNTIRDALPLVGGQAPSFPTSEDQLEILHLIVKSCSVIANNHRTPSNILNDNGLHFPTDVNYLIRNVAYYFHLYDAHRTNTDYHGFMDRLVEFMKDNDTHIATTNYDNLLYSSLLNANILASRFNETRLVDGFTGTRNLIFDESNLERKFDNNFGWYLHLHGSPLFFTHPTTRNIHKLLSADAYGEILQSNQEKRFTHIVLNHFSQKPEIISGSDLLSTYWDYFSTALEESDTVVVFGYAGGDKHINRKIYSWVAKQKRSQQNFNLVVVHRPEDDLTWVHAIIFENFGRIIPVYANLDFREYDSLLDFEWDI